MIKVPASLSRAFRYSGLLLVPLVVQAASFDCGKASNLVEQEICQNPRLSTLDEQMANIYMGIMASAVGVEAKKDLRASQRRWLTSRDKCRNETCLESHYQGRLLQLGALEVVAVSRSPRPVLTPRVVWNQGDMVYRSCAIPDFGCVLQLMKGSGASPEAMDFVRRQEAWVVDFTEYGNTDLLRLETFRANTNQYYALASQAAGVIDAEGYDFSPLDKQRREVQTLLSLHPQAFFIAKPDFVRHEAGTNGGSRFIFRDTLAECRACEPLATGELIYAFDAAGGFLGVGLGDLQPL
jgi:uncharacterized protein